MIWPELASAHCWSISERGSCSKSHSCLCVFLCLIVNCSSVSHLPFSSCQWSDSERYETMHPLSGAARGRSTKQCSAPVRARSRQALELVTLWSLLTSNLLRFTFFFFFLWYILQKPTLGREGPVASLLHCRRATLAFQSIYYEIKWIPLGLIPCCNCNEKKQFLTLHLRSITIKIH